MFDENRVKAILAQSNKIAIVGLSDKEGRDSNRVAQYLHEKGYKVIPVNPNVKEVLGGKSFPSLKELTPGSVDIVVVFRKSEDIPPIVGDVIRLKPKLFWLQIGITHEESIHEVEKVGIVGVENRCIMVEHRRLYS